MYIVDTDECTYSGVVSFEIRVAVDAVPDLLHEIYK